MEEGQMKKIRENASNAYGVVTGSAHQGKKVRAHLRAKIHPAFNKNL